MFLIATVIVLLSCIEITSSSSTVQICSVFSSIKHAHDGSVVRTDYKLVQFQLQQLSTPAAIFKIVVKFLIKQIILLGLAGYQMIITNEARYLSFDIQRALVE